MPLKPKKEEKKGGVAGKAALLVGGAGLLLFILGVKRRYRLADGMEIEQPDLSGRPAGQDEDGEEPAERGRGA